MSDVQSSLMFVEAAEAAEVVSRQLTDNAQLMRELGNRFRATTPNLIFTCARGSSDHAATYAKYLIETRLRIPTLSQAPSISSIYGGPLLHMGGMPFFVISQSGQSPDLLSSASSAKDAGALIIALVNDVDSPLAALSDIVIPLHAGPEHSVAATKSYLGTLATIAQLVAEIDEDAQFKADVAQLPEILAKAWQQDWSDALEPLAAVRNMFVVGRGLTLAIAQEAALKFKETCRLHAEAFSAAEVSHGPMALVEDGFPVFAFVPQDRASLGIDTLMSRFARDGASVFSVGAKINGCVLLPMASGIHPSLAPIAMAQSFYRFVNALSFARGLDPDRPPRLKKVTETR